MENYDDEDLVDPEGGEIVSHRCAEASIPKEGEEEEVVSDCEQDEDVAPREQSSLALAPAPGPAEPDTPQNQWERKLGQLQVMLGMAEYYFVQAGLGM